MNIQQLKQLPINLVVAGIAALGVSLSPMASATPVFRDVTTSAGIKLTREETFSISWVDFNSDGRPDLWITPHGYRSLDDQRGAQLPSLYLNQGDGKFTNIISQVWPVGITGDTHGSAWADFDNDGDPDVLVVTGAFGGYGQVPNFFFVNNRGRLQEQAVTLGLDYPLGRGRSPLWFDWNRYGLLNVLQLNEIRRDGRAPTALFQQTTSGFNNVRADVGLQVDEPSEFAQLADLSGDGSLDLVIQSKYRYPHKLYDITTVPFKNLTNNFPAYTSVSDAAIADFDGDLHPDVFLPRNTLDPRSSSIFKADEHTVYAQLVAKRGEVGVSFKTNGNVIFDFPVTPVTEIVTEIKRSQIFIGSKGRHPGKLGFSLSPNDPTVRGIKPHTLGSQAALYIGFDPTTQTWKALLSTSKKKELNLVIETPKPLSDVAGIGFGSLNLSQHDLQDVLLLYNTKTKQYVDRTQESGLGNPLLAESAVAGDFDNDMDVDLYVTRGYRTFNLPSILYENQGNGTFIAASNAGGMAGRNLGFHLDKFTNFIAGPSIAVADYDVDGFLDLFVSNTIFKATQKHYLGSPHQLFRNLGNRNHWLELDLQGVVSNRDGIGARILATAGGVTQLREQGGGMHLFSQNQQRIHFGLGSHTRVDHIEIHWPSGIVQKIDNVPADQVLRIVEGNGRRQPQRR